MPFKVGNVLGGLFVRRGFVSWHAEFFVGPATEVYQLASLRAEGARGVILPLDGFSTCRTLHKGKSKKLKGKSQDGLQSKSTETHHFTFAF
jgi:hypothetical protein